MSNSIISNPVDSDMFSINQASNRIGNLGRGKAISKSQNEAKVNEAAADFEAQFISQMLENMFATVDTKESLGGDDSQEIYRSMLVDQYGKAISKAGGIGIADHVKREILRLQEV
ncbi:MAG: rod-binding protein [Rickettsiales bacterium]